MAKLNVSTPSGFPEFTPVQERERQRWIGIIKSVFEKHGFPQIDTPLVERAENFVAKGGNPKEIYILDRLLREEAVDQDKDQRAIRFDHTVPLALYVARHFNDLTFPFRRSAIGPVLRGERAQKGRFRQFDQCDIDVIGNGSLSLLNDAQMVAIIVELFEQLMPEQKFKVRINNRKLLIGMAEFFEKDPKELFQIFDEEEKVGPEVSKQRMEKFVGNDPKKLNAWLEFMKFARSGKNVKDTWATDEWEEGLEWYKKAGFLGKIGAEGAHELIEVCKILRNDLGISPEKFGPDMHIARGLDYYTGTVYETTLIDYPELGTICAGGRYDDLAKVFTGKDLPGVGISIGLTRLLWQLFDAKILNPTQSSSSDVIVLSRDENCLSEALKIGALIRSAGIAVENYLEPKKIQKQFDYAKKMGIPVAVIVGENDVVIENFERKIQKETSQKSVVQDIKSLL
jgi:histidyl-tRNA synthetase